MIFRKISFILDAFFLQPRGRTGDDLFHSVRSTPESFRQRTWIRGYIRNTPYKWWLKYIKNSVFTTAFLTVYLACYRLHATLSLLVQFSTVACRPAVNLSSVVQP